MFADCSFTQCFRGRAAVEEEIFSLVELTSAQSQRVTVFPESINDGQYTLSDQKNRSLSAQCYIITELACCSQTFKPAFSFLAGSYVFLCFTPATLRHLQARTVIGVNTDKERKSYFNFNICYTSRQ